MEAVVDGAVPLRFGLPRVQPGAERLPFALDGEVHDRGGTAPRRGPGTGLERVRGLRAPKGHLHVGVDIDRSRQHQPTGGVDALGPVGKGGDDLGARGGQRHDALAVDQDICGLRPGGGDDGTPGDQGAHKWLLSAGPGPP